MEIRRIGTSAQSPSTGRKDTSRAQRQQAAEAQPASLRAGLFASGMSGTRAPQSFRPVAAFLAQYVDQSFPWTRSPQRKDRKRQRATSAYITADMLPDLLAETLRLRIVDRKF
ncbi:hypothetical protein F2P47_01940 [Parvibaculum sedimenti]|uniref:Uncharacterized protein n=1 Tax=Parvibaculum sedimenti TaxID=2608632 RepID=A0A6N6VQH1_9HYPH|nr:hypothetical protein [Parvibaculum sedimenti]KAB7742061.1 hypothetical protein F2P47_01940 [Parvibaculum sedimenti]